MAVDKSLPKFLQDQEKDNASFFAFDSYSDALFATLSDPSLKTPFTIAINGDWGSGKTSLMKTVARKINSSSSAKCLVIWFNAWQYEKSEQPLWSSFLNVVLSEVVTIGGTRNRERFKRIGQKVATISAEVLLSRVSGLAPSDIRQLTSTLQDNLKEIKTLRDQMSQAISDSLSTDKRRRQRVVIFVDDLDRCLPDAVVDVFESIKLFLDCERCVFLLGFDKEQVKRAFESKFPEKGEDLGIRYIEKFVQLEFELPPKTSPQVEEFFKAVAPAELKDNEAVLKIISEFIQPNPRKILRWLNRLIFIQELFRQGTAPGSFHRPETVPAWVFIKSFFPEFAKLVEKDTSVLRLAFERAKGKTTPEENEKLKEITTDRLLDDFLRSVDESVITDPRLPEVIFQTKQTITESVSTLQPESLIQKIDGIRPEEVDSVASELMTNSRAKALEAAKLIGERLATVKDYPEYAASQNRIRFFKQIVNDAPSDTEKKSLYEIIVNIMKSPSRHYLEALTDELKSLLIEQNIHKDALKNGDLDIFVSNLVDATSWDSAGRFSEIVLLFNTELTQTQINKIALAALSNDQIYGSYRAIPDLTKILVTNKHAVSREIWSRLLKERGKSFKLED